MTYAEMRAAQFEVCRNWLKQYADEGVGLSEAARRSGTHKNTIARIANQYGVIFSRHPKKIRQRSKSPAKAELHQAELHQAEASLKAQLSHHTKRLLNAGYKPDAAKMEAFRTVKANIEREALK